MIRLLGQRRGRSGRLISLALATALLGGCVAAEAASDSPVRNAGYSGSVGPGWGIGFKVSANGKRVEKLVAAFDEGCNGAPASTAPKFHFGTLTISGGRFSGQSIDHFGAKVSESLHISGHFSGRTAKGEISDTSHITSLPNCTESSPFTATAR